MFDQTLAGDLAFAVNCVSSLLLIGAGLWVLRRVKLPCLPWVIACWVLHSPLLALLDSLFMNTLLRSHLPTQGVSLSGIGLFPKKEAMRQYMGWTSFESSLAFFTIILLLVADATLLVDQLKPNVSDRVPRVFGLVRTYSTAFGFLALLLTLVVHILSLLMAHIAP